jgi:hypothetical protein
VAAAAAIEGIAGDRLIVLLIAGAGWAAGAGVGVAV